MHRRTNSYSYTAAERVSPAHAELSHITSCNEEFVRGATERRSLDRIKQSLEVQSKLRHRGYFAVNVTQAVPAAIKYAVSEEANCTLPLPSTVPPPSILMQRPRSPSKSSRMEILSDNSLLDQALAAIKEQLVSLHVLLRVGSVCVQRRYSIRIMIIRMYMYVVACSQVDSVLACVGSDFVVGENSLSLLNA